MHMVAAWLGCQSTMVGTGTWWLLGLAVKTPCLGPADGWLLGLAVKAPWLGPAHGWLLGLAVKAPSWDQVANSYPGCKGKKQMAP